MTISTNLNSEWKEHFILYPQHNNCCYCTMLKSKAEQHKETCEDELKWLDGFEIDKSNNWTYALDKREQHLKSEIALLNKGVLKQ